MNTKVHQKPWKQHSGQITFVQISDIHLDRQYAEVHNYFIILSNVLLIKDALCRVLLSTVVFICVAEDGTMALWVMHR